MELLWLQRFRFLRLLERGPVGLCIAIRHPGVQGLEDQKERFPRVILIAVGRVMHPEVHDHHLTFVAPFQGLEREVTVPWQAVLRSDPWQPVLNGGTPLGAAAAPSFARAA